MYSWKIVTNNCAFHKQIPGAIFAQKRPPTDLEKWMGKKNRNEKNEEGMTENEANSLRTKETLHALISLSNEKVCVFLVDESIHVQTSLTMILFITAKGGGEEKGE